MHGGRLESKNHPITIEFPLKSSLGFAMDEKSEKLGENMIHTSITKFSVREGLGRSRHSGDPRGGRL